jgi:hypothetical protein
MSKLFLSRRLVLRNGRRRRRRGRLRLRLRRFHSRKHGRRPRPPRRKNRKRDRRKHKDDRGPGRRPGKNRSRAARTERCLAALTAESRSQVSTLPALQQHDCNQKQTNDHVNHYDQNGHCKTTPSGPQPNSNSDISGLTKMVRKGGFEPPRLSAPPPQDGVSASSTTSALKSILCRPFEGDQSPHGTRQSYLVPAASCLLSLYTVKRGCSSWRVARRQSCSPHICVDSTIRLLLHSLLDSICL